MEPINLSMDDVHDVQDMTKELEEYIKEKFNDYDSRLVFSAMMSVFINKTIEQSESIVDLIVKREILFGVFDQIIASIKDEDKDEDKEEEDG